MTQRQNQGAGKRNAPTVPLDYYDSKLEKRTPSLFFVFYGGEVTERKYFVGLRTDLASMARNKSQFVHLKYVRGTPEQMVQSVLEELQVRQQESTADTHEDIVWVVFDKDDFDNYSTAISSAHQADMKVAYSNECFELWLLLHFQEQKSQIRRAALTELLRTKWEETTGLTIDSEKRVKHFPYGIIRTHGDRTAATERAKLLLAQAEVTSPKTPWEANPVTTVYELVEQLIEFFAE
jgi:hypothetical protein